MFAYSFSRWSPRNQAALNSVQIRFFTEGVFGMILYKIFDDVSIVTFFFETSFFFDHRSFFLPNSQIFQNTTRNLSQNVHIWLLHYECYTTRNPRDSVAMRSLKRYSSYETLSDQFRPEEIL